SDGGIAETVHFCPTIESLICAPYDYPVFAFDSANSPNCGEERIQVLLDMLETYCRNQGNDALRFSIMEATALALGRAFGARAKYKKALAAVDKGLAVKPYSIHLKAAKHTLLLKSEGKRAPPRLEKFVGDD